MVTLSSDECTAGTTGKGGSRIIVFPSAYSQREAKPRREMAGRPTGLRMRSPLPRPEARVGVRGQQAPKHAHPEVPTFAQNRCESGGGPEPILRLWHSLVLYLNCSGNQNEMQHAHDKGIAIEDISGIAGRSSVRRPWGQIRGSRYVGIRG